MSIREGHDDPFAAELEQALSEAFAVRPDPFRQVAIRAQVIAEMRDIHSERSVQGALNHVYAVQPSATKYEHYRRMAIAAAREPAVEKESLFSRALAVFRGGNYSFERRLNDCIDAVVSGRATTNDCLQRYPEDADRLAPLLGMAFELRSEYASLPFEQRLSGVRWRVQRAAQTRETTPLGAEGSGGGFLRNLQWAAPLTTGVAASFLLGFLVFQAYLDDSGGGVTLDQAGNPNVPVQGDPLSFAALNEVTADNEYLSQFQSTLERVYTAVQNNQPPAAEDLEALTQQTSELQEQVEAGGLQSEERQAAVNLAGTAAVTLQAAAPLVEDEDKQELLVTSIELIDQLNSAIASTALPGSEGDEEEEEPTDAEPPTEPTEPADDGEGDGEPGEGEEDEEVDLVELVGSHRVLSERLAGPTFDAALLRDYMDNLDRLEEAIESEEGSADETFLTDTLELLALDKVELDRRAETLESELLTEVLARRTEAYEAAERALSELQSPDETATATPEEQTD